MAFCFIIGCNHDFDQTNDGIARICPRCNNASIVGGMQKTYLEVCFIPLPFLPLHRKQVWQCHICQWFVDADRGEPRRVGTPLQPQGGGAYSGQGPPPPGRGNPPQPGYGPNPGMIKPQGSGISGQYPGRR